MPACSIPYADYAHSDENVLMLTPTLYVMSAVGAHPYA